MGEVVFLLVFCLLIEILVNFFRVFFFLFLKGNGFKLNGEDLIMDDVGVVGGIKQELYKLNCFVGFLRYVSDFGEFFEGVKVL